MDERRRFKKLAVYLAIFTLFFQPVLLLYLCFKHDTPLKSMIFTVPISMMPGLFIAALVYFWKGKIW